LLAQLNSVLTGVGSSTEAYHPSNKTVIFFSFGRWHATGQVGNWKVFGFLVCLMKGRRLFIDRACNYVSGKSKQHAA
jgi:hypothetical protein